MGKFAEDIKRMLIDAGLCLLRHRTAVLFMLAVAMAVLSFFEDPSGIEIQEEAVLCIEGHSGC